MSSIKIAFVHDWDVNFQQELDWQDGLSAALVELERRGHEVVRFVNTARRRNFIPNPHGHIIATPSMSNDVIDMKPDVVLVWGDMTRPVAPKLVGKFPMALCFAGGDPLGENVPLFDHIFVESQVYKTKLEEAGCDNVSIAFGTNTNLFTPINQNRLIDTIFPATFALWKRHNLYALATKGLKSLACGYIYKDHETECWQDCLKAGVTILPHVSAEVLHFLYAASKVCVVPSRSDGGSQRTVLEAMAMNLPLVVCDSDKFDYLAGVQFLRAEPNILDLRSAIDQALQTEVNTRDHVLDNWSQVQYADALEAGLRSLL